MQCYTQLTPPTAVTASVSLPFLSSAANNLIVAKTSLLQVFALKSVVADYAESSRDFHSRGKQSERLQRRDRVHSSKLVLISEYEISGTITALARVKAQRSKSGGELLLVALKAAKLSLVEWDPERYCISTVSIHYYETDDLQGSPWAPPISQCTNYLTVDPGSRCAALKFGARHVAILPLNQLGDDLVMDDFDADVDSKSKRRQSSIKINGDTSQASASCLTSFVLSLLVLDPALTHPVHLAFLHEYREPTIGILSSPTATSSALLHERRDGLSYTVYTLDLEQRASTTLLSVSGIPYDVHSILPLPLPIGGALLIGCNEFIHVDQSGKTNGVAVNEFAKQCSSFPLVSQSDLGLRLEGCVVEQLGSANGELLAVLNNGHLAILSFKLDGRSVSGLSVSMVPSSQGGNLLSAPVSCMATVGRGRIFLGSEDADSVILGWSSRVLKPTRKRSTHNIDLTENGIDLDSDLESLDDDDLYADTKPEDNKKHLAMTPSLDGQPDDFLFRIHDQLLNLGPLGSISIANSRTQTDTWNGYKAEASTRLDMIVSSGCGHTSTLTRLNPNITLANKQRLNVSGISRIWSIRTESVSSNGKVDAENENHNAVITTVKTESGNQESNIFVPTKSGLEQLPGTDFESEAGETVEIYAILGGIRVVQILQGEVRAYDGDFSLAQIVPVLDETGDSEPKIIATSIAEPYILLLRDDFRAMVLRADDAGDLEEIETSGTLLNGQWKAGSLFDDVNDVFRLTFDGMDEDNSSSVLMFLLDKEGGLQIFRLPNLETPVYTANGLSFVPPFLSTGFNARRSAAKDDIVELLVTELGDTIYKAPYLILRSLNDDLTIYSPYQVTGKDELNDSLHFLKISTQFLPLAPEEDESEIGNVKQKHPLRVLQDINGYSSVFMPRTSPCFILKSSSSEPRIIGVSEARIQSLVPFNSIECQKGVIFSGEDGHVCTAQLPAKTDYSTGWTMERLFSGDRIRAFDYHGPKDRFIIGSSRKMNFKLPDDELHPEWQDETTSFLPQLERDRIELLDPSTWSITDTFELETNEVVMCIKTMSLETSESTHKRRPLTVVGTAILRGEDLNTQGCIYVFDVIDVVPEPDRPETGRKLKLISKVKDKGAVTAISQVGSEGFLLAAHGQKCFVRGLKEDGTLLPVAFLDIQCYVGIAKELRGTGFCVLGDAVKGIWLTGYTEDPYHLKTFGKSAHNIEVVAAEFLPEERGLCLVLADADSNIRLFQFDPHNPKSLSGQRLLHMSTFHTGDYASTMTILPRVPTSWEHVSSLSHLKDAMDIDSASHSTQQILVTSQNGSISLITPLSSQTYRSLTALQSYLSNTLVYPLGLSSKAYRAVEVDMTIGGRAMLDGNVLRRWMDLGSWKRAESVMRVGVDVEWEVRTMLEGIGGRGLGFL